MAQAGRPDRYAVGETMVDTRRLTQDLLVIVRGRAQLVLLDPDGDEAIISEVTGPQAVGMIEAPSEGTVILRASSDCEVITIDASTASEIGSRNSDIATALNRTTEIRRRRVDRVVERKMLAE